MSASALLAPILKDNVLVLYGIKHACTLHTYRIKFSGFSETVLCMGLMHLFVVCVILFFLLLYRQQRKKTCVWGFENNKGTSVQSDQRLCYSL